jgi:hypothetical protein
LAVFWNTGQPPADLDEAFHEVYRRVLPQALVARLDRRSIEEAHAGMRAKAADGMRATGAFDQPEQWQFEWKQDPSVLAGVALGHLRRRRARRAERLAVGVQEPRGQRRRASPRAARGCLAPLGHAHQRGDSRRRARPFSTASRPALGGLSARRICSRRD